MIKSFKDKETEKIFNGINSKKFNAIQKVAKRKLDILHFAFAEQDLIVPPSNHFEHLKGNYSDKTAAEYRGRHSRRPLCGKPQL